jgi:hypothetical protein
MPQAAVRVALPESITAYDHTHHINHSPVRGRRVDAVPAAADGAGQQP